MKNKTKKYFHVLLLIIAFSSLAIVISAFFTNSTIAAGSFSYTPMEKIPGGEQAGSDFPSYVNSIYKFGIWAIGICAMLMIMIGGFMYITSAGNNASMGKAKGIITDAIIGLVMALMAYLILYEINPDLVKLPEKNPSTSSSDSDNKNEKNKEECNKYCNDYYGNDSSKKDEIDKCFSDCMAAKKAQDDKGSGGEGNGKCEEIKTGPCSSENLAATCFGSNASQASKICNVESHGDPTIGSGVDKCADGNSASWGLFQINITANKIGGLNCPSAFSGGAYTSKNHSCRVSDQSLFNQCVAAAKDPSTNIATACRIGNNGAKWGQWGANSKCGFNK